MVLDSSEKIIVIIISKIWPLIGINLDINYYSLTRCSDVHHCLYSSIQRLHRNRILLVRIFFHDNFYSTALYRALRSWWSPKTCHTILYNFIEIIIIENNQFKFKSYRIWSTFCAICNLQQFALQRHILIWCILRILGVQLQRKAFLELI